MAQTLEQLIAQLREATQQSRFLTKEFEVLERAGTERIQGLVQNSRYYEKAINDVTLALKRLQAEERTLQKTNLLNVNAIPGNYRGSIGGGTGNIGGMGGVQIPVRGLSPQQDVFTRGRISELNTFQAFPETNRALYAQKKAIEEIERIYGKLTDEVAEYKTEIDAATGRVTVHAQVLRRIGGQTQKAWVSATADPLTGVASTLSDSQQRFIQGAGGIERANQMLARYGMSVNNVTGAYKDLTSNVTRFSIASADGIETAMGHMDQFGNFTIQASRNASTLVANIERNIVKVVEWAAATAVIYTLLNQISQAGQQLDDIQEAMAGIQIATGAAADELGRYYDAALQAANLTGVNVTETLEAQQAAYRASADSANRFATANNLLRDSMVLARLGEIDQEESLDTLVASLRNANLTLDDGSVLLDKWVRITQNAGTSVHTLADAFAITSSVADTAGVDIDQLNAIIAVLDEKTTLSSEEVGNALRTMFANITTPEAISTLEEFGIAVRNVDGSMRSWMDITQNIVDLMNTGLLSDEQINRLANALGGGSRRGPQILQLWQNFGKVQGLAAESMAANGEAAAAMDIKLSALQSHVNELNNAFNELITTLGFEGGFVEALTEGLKVATNLVRTINDLAKALDGSVVSIVAAVAAFTALRRIASSLNIQGPQVDQFGKAIPNTGSPFYGMAQTLTGTPTGIRQSLAQGALAGTPIAIGEIAQGISGHKSWQEVGPRVGASIAGAVVGNLILPGVGGLIGSVIADGFVAGIQAQQDALREISQGAPATPEEAERRITEAFSPNYLGSYFSSAFGAAKRTLPEYSDLELAQLTARAIQAGAPVGLAAMGPGAPGQLTNLGFTGNENYALQQILASLDEDQARLLVKAVQDYNTAIENQANAMEQAAQEAETPEVFQHIATLSQTRGAGLRGAFSAQQETSYRQALISGDLGGYAERVSLMRQLETVTATVAVAQGKLNISTEEYVSLGNLLADISDEERSKIVTLSSSINDLTAEQERLIESQATDPERVQEILRLGEINRLLQDQRSELTQLLSLSERAAAIRHARETYIGFTEGPTGAEGQRLTRRESGFYQALQQAREAQDEYAQYLGIDPEILRESVTDPLVIAFADGYTRVEGLTSDFTRLLLDKMKETAEEMSRTLQFSFKDIRDVSSSTIDSAAFRNRLSYYERLMSSFAPAGYQEENQNIGLLLQGNQTRTLNTTMTALNLTLEELVDVEKKQLEGVWNLPSGATAYVPITSLFYQQQNAGLPGSDTLEQSSNTFMNATNQFSNSVASMDSWVQSWQQGGAGAGVIAEQQRRRDEIESADSWVRSWREGGSGRGVTEPTVTETTENINIQLQPTRINLNISGRVISEAISQEQALDLQRRSRSSGSKTRVAI